MATRSAGRVTIRVIPDSTGFRRDLKTALERIEKTTHVDIPARLTVTRESIAHLKEQLRDLEVRIKVEPYVTQESLHNLKKNIEDVDPDVRVGLNAALARARLANLTRPRTVTIFARINKASVASVAATLAALSGARFLGNVFDKLFDSIKNLDKTAPKILSITSALIGLGGVAGALVSNLFGLGAGLAQLGQISVLLPSLMVSAGISIGVLIAALKDMKTVLADLGPAFTQLQDKISGNYWEIAAQPIRELVNTLMPNLTKNLVGTARAWGVVTKELANSLKRNLTNDRLDNMFGNMNTAIERVSAAMEPLVAAFTRLGLTGSQYLPRLANWLVDLSNKFNNFIQAAGDDGRLERWAETGIQAFKDLGNIIRNTTRVLAAFARAAQMAGGAGLGDLAAGLDKLAITLNKPAFQAALSTILASAHLAVDGLIDGLNRLGPGLANFAPTIARVFAEVGKILGQFGENIGALLSTPELQDGLVRMFSGFLTFLTDLKPAMEPLGRIIGVVADAIGTFLSYFGLLLADVAPYAATFFEDLWAALKPLIPTLTDLIRELLPPFAEILTVLAKEVLPELIPIIKELAPIFADLIIAFAPVLVEFLKNFAAGLREISPYVKPVGDAIEKLAEAFKGLPLAFYQKSTGDDGGFLGTMMKFMKEHPTAASYLTGIGIAIQVMGDSLAVFGKGGAFIEWILQLAAALKDPAGIVQGTIDLAAAIVNLSSTKEGWDTFWGTLGGIISLISPIGPAFQAMVTAVQAGVTTVTQLFAPWSTFWGSLSNPVSIAITLITGTLNGGFPSILGAIVTGMASIVNFWVGKWPTLIPTVISTLFNVAGSVSAGFPGIIASIIGGMIRVGFEFANGWRAVLSEIPGWFSRYGSAITIGIGVAVGIMSGMPARMLGAIAGAASRFFAAGEALLGNFADGVRRGIGTAVAVVSAAVKTITDLLPGSPAKKGPLSGRGWTKIRGQHLIEDLAAGMRERTGLVQTASHNAASTIQFGDGNVSWSSADSAAGTSDRALVHIEGDYYGATPEAVSADFDKRIRRANTIHKLGMTGVKS